MAFIPNPFSGMSTLATRASFSFRKRYISTNPTWSSHNASHSSLQSQGLTALEWPPLVDVGWMKSWRSTSPFGPSLKAVM